MELTMLILIAVLGAINCVICSFIWYGIVKRDNTSFTETEKQKFNKDTVPEELEQKVETASKEYPHDSKVPNKEEGCGEKAFASGCEGNNLTETLVSEGTGQETEVVCNEDKSNDIGNLKEENSSQIPNAIEDETSKSAKGSNCETSVKKEKIEDKKLNLEEQIAKLQEENCRLNEEVVRLNGDVAAHQTAKKQAERDYYDFKEKNEKLKKENGELKQSNETLRNDKKTLEREKKKLTDDNTKLKTTNDTYKRSWKKSGDLLKQKYVELDSQFEELNCKLGELEEEKVTIVAAHKKLEEELSSANESIEEKCNTIETIKSEKEIAEKEKAELEEEVKELKSEKAKTDKSLQALTTEKDKVEKDLAEKVENVNYLKEYIAAIEKMTDDEQIELYSKRLDLWSRAKNVFNEINNIYNKNREENDVMCLQSALYDIAVIVEDIISREEDL